MADLVQDISDSAATLASFTTQLKPLSTAINEHRKLLHEAQDAVASAKKQHKDVQLKINHYTESYAKYDAKRQSMEAEASRLKERLALAAESVVAQSGQDRFEVRETVADLNDVLKRKERLLQEKNKQYLSLM